MTSSLDSASTGTVSAQAGSWFRRHPISDADRDAMTGLRAQVVANKGRLQGTSAREPFNAITERVAAPEGVSFRPGTVGGVPGVWCTPPAPRAGEVLLHLHDGWFTWGTAHAFRNLVGQIAARVGIEAFVPDYRLAPEHPFPAGLDDARACYFDLTERRTVSCRHRRLGRRWPGIAPGCLRNAGSGRLSRAFARDRPGPHR